MSQLALLPIPRQIDFGTGTVHWGSEPTGIIPIEWQSVVENSGWNFRKIENLQAPQVIIRKIDGLGDEGYSIKIDDISEISASTAAGLNYALTTLRQYGTTQMHRVEIVDSPKYSWRGCHLDVSRHFFNVDTVCRFMGLLAEHRLNRLHLHLNDDQGWRIEIPSWPLLTEIGAWRDSTPIGHEDDGVDDAKFHGGFYTAEDIKVIREHAEKLFIQIVPEIDLPGHAQAILAAYPRLGNTDLKLHPWVRWGISDHVLNVSDEALAFAEDIVTYIASLFPGSPIHIGGDECPTVEWEESAAAHEVMRLHGFTHAQQLQGLYTQRLAKVLQAKGHEVIAWDEVLDAAVPSGTIIAAWRSSGKGIEAVDRGFDVVMAPMEYLYFDWLSSDKPGEPIAQAPLPEFTPWEKVYEFKVIPEGLAPEKTHHIRGAQVQLWTEYISTQDHLDYMAFPRICAFSEVVWGSSTAVEKFRPRLHEHLVLHQKAGVKFRPLDLTT
jgi:hexosaminidase